MASYLSVMRAFAWVTVACIMTPAYLSTLADDGCREEVNAPRMCITMQGPIFNNQPHGEAIPLVMPPLKEN